MFQVTFEECLPTFTVQFVIFEKCSQVSHPKKQKFEDCHATVEHKQFRHTLFSSSLFRSVFQLFLLIFFPVEPVLFSLLELFFPKLVPVPDNSCSDSRKKRLSRENVLMERR